MQNSPLYKQRRVPLLSSRFKAGSVILKFCGGNLRWFIPPICVPSCSPLYGTWWVKMLQNACFGHARTNNVQIRSLQNPACYAMALQTLSLVMLGGKKNPINTKHINIFLTGLAGQSPRDEPPPVSGTNRTKWRFYSGTQQKATGFPRDRSWFVPGTGPVCPRDGSCLSRTPSRPKCLCLYGANKTHEEFQHKAFWAF